MKEFADKQTVCFYFQTVGNKMSVSNKKDVGKQTLTQEIINDAGNPSAGETVTCLANSDESKIQNEEEPSNVQEDASLLGEAESLKSPDSARPVSSDPVNFPQTSTIRRCIGRLKYLSI